MAAESDRVVVLHKGRVAPEGPARTVRHEVLTGFLGV